MAKKILLGVALVAAIGIGVYSYKGWPPSQSGTEGTVQAAKRQHTEQIKASDVAIQDPDVQAFLQTDFFHKLVTDKAFQRMVANGTMQQAAALGGDRLALLSNALERSDFRNAVLEKNAVAIERAVQTVAVGRSDADRLALVDLAMTAFGRAGPNNTVDKGKGDVSNVLEANALGRANSGGNVVDKGKTDLSDAMAALDRVFLSRGEKQQLDLASFSAAAFERTQVTAALEKQDQSALRAELEKVGVSRQKDVVAALEKVAEVARVDVAMRTALSSRNEVALKQELDKVTFANSAVMARADLERAVTQVLMRSDVVDAAVRGEYRSVLTKAEQASADRQAWLKNEFERTTVVAADRVQFMNALAGHDMVAAHAVFDKITVDRVNVTNRVDRNDLAAMLDRVENRASVGKRDELAAHEALQRVEVARLDLDRRTLQELASSAALDRVMHDKTAVSDLLSLDRGALVAAADSRVFSQLLASHSFQQAAVSGDMRAFAGE